MAWVNFIIALHGNSILKKDLCQTQVVLIVCKFACPQEIKLINYKWATSKETSGADKPVWTLGKSGKSHKEPHSQTDCQSEKVEKIYGAHDCYGRKEMTVHSTIYIMPQSP